VLVIVAICVWIEAIDGWTAAEYPAPLVVAVFDLLRSNSSSAVASRSNVCSTTVGTSIFQRSMRVLKVPHGVIALTNAITFLDSAIGLLFAS
jgi:hypothetical protein